MRCTSRCLVPDNAALWTCSLTAPYFAVNQFNVYVAEAVSLWGRQMGMLTCLCGLCFFQGGQWGYCHLPAQIFHPAKRNFKSNTRRNNPLVQIDMLMPRAYQYLQDK